MWKKPGNKFTETLLMAPLLCPVLCYKHGVRGDDWMTRSNLRVGDIDHVSKWVNGIN
jgi:hypothetical protein